MKYLIVGLGNIGEEYSNTRHNIGFIILDALANNLEVRFGSGRYSNYVEAKFRGRNLILVKPTTYMNLSGKAVNYWIKQENIPIENVLIIVDDIALPLGTIRMKSKGSDGGHNGLISIIESIGSNQFPRLRFGIGNNFAKGYQVDYVLGKWTKSEEKELLPKIETSVDIIKSFIMSGIDFTMNTYNNK